MTLPRHDGRPRTHLLTVALEDYLHAGAFNAIVQRGQGHRFETRLERNSLRALDLLGRFGLRATFFVHGWVADHRPELVREVAARGHEVANRGYYHRSIRQMTPEEFREDLLRSGEAIERATGQPPAGYRVARGALAPEDLWALDVLAEEGYAYDSSLMPSFRRFQGEPWRRFAHRHWFGERSLWEFPLSSAPVLGWVVPIAGGAFFRHLPHAWVSRAVERWHRTVDHPFVMYFHVWELDPERPRIDAGPPLARIARCRGLARTSRALEYYLARYRFTSVADYLAIEREGVGRPGTGRDAPLDDPPLEPTSARVSARHPADAAPPRPPISVVVVPCGDHASAPPRMAAVVERLEAVLGADYDVAFVLVDDGSPAGAASALHRRFGGRASCSILRLASRRGVAASILAGIRHASTEIVCSVHGGRGVDARELARMISLLGNGVDLVTAASSPGSGGRGVLARLASALYGRILGQDLWGPELSGDDGAGVAVYRRSAVVDLPLGDAGELGTTEVLARLILRGGRVVACPVSAGATASGRGGLRRGQALGHLRLLIRLALLRAVGAGKRSTQMPGRAGRMLGRRPIRRF